MATADPTSMTRGPVCLLGYTAFQGVTNRWWNLRDVYVESI